MFQKDSEFKNLRDYAPYGLVLGVTIVFLKFFDFGTLNLEKPVFWAKNRFIKGLWRKYRFLGHKTVFLDGFLA